MKPLTASRIWFAVFVIVIFAAGIASGIALDRYLVAGFRPRPGVMPRGGPNPAQIAQRMSRDLDLSAEQRGLLQEILRRNRGRLEELQVRARKDFEAVRAQMDEEIKAILTPEQRVKFEEQMQRRSRDGRRRPGRGPGPGAPPPQ